MLYFDTRRGFPDINPKTGCGILLHAGLKMFRLALFNLFGVAVDEYKGAEEFDMCFRFVPFEFIIINVETTSAKFLGLIETTCHYDYWTGERLKHHSPFLPVH